MLITNGTCVSRIMKSRAGSSGSRRRHDSLRRNRRPARGRDHAVDPRLSGGAHGAGGAVLPCVRSPPHSGCDALAVLERGIDWRPPGDHRGELLGALVADVLELRDADILDPRKARPLASCRGCRSARPRSRRAWAGRTRRRPSCTPGSRRSTSRVPGGIAAHPPGIFDPASFRYCGPVANEMYFQPSVRLARRSGDRQRP